MTSIYKIGDDVVLKCIHLPQYNGDYCIFHILESGDSYLCRLTGRLLRYTGERVYVLDEPLLDPVTGCESAFGEACLRRRYPPSTESFKEMMLNLTRITM